MATRDYTLGKGKVTFLKDNTASLAVLAAGGFQDMGNAPAMAVSLATEKLEHQSSRDGIGLVDMSVVTKTSATGSFTLDEPNAANLAYFFMDDAVASGSPATVTTQAVDKTGYLLTNVWYPIQLVGSVTKTNGAITAASTNKGTAVLAYHGTPGAQITNVTTVYDVRIQAEGASGALTLVARANGGAWSNTPITITDTASFNLAVGAGDTDTGLNLMLDACANAQEGDLYSFTVTATDSTGLRVTDITAFVCDSKVSGTDYTLDAAAGLVMFLTTVGTITTCTVSGKTGNKDTIEGFSTSQMKGWLYYVANPAAGIPVDVIGYCRVSPSGDLALIGTDWTQMQFTVDFLKVEGFPIVKIETREKV